MSEPAKDEAELITQAARATCECQPKGCYVLDGATWCSASNQDSVIATLAAIRAAGWAVVPVEPTREMLRAGYDESGGRAVIGIWEAMLETAPGVKP
jgi:hypothetical protein